MSDKIKLVFKSICSFVNDLENVFGEKQHSLVLYNHLINKTTVENKKPVEKHIELFKQFCIVNRDVLIGKNLDNLVETKIIYSENVYIDLSAIVKIADEESKKSILCHLLTISTLVDENSKSDEILKKISSENKTENDFVNNLLQNVEKKINVDENSMENTFNGMMESGIFSEVLNSVSDNVDSGKIDINKLLSTVEGMVSTLSTELKKEENKEKVENAMETVNTMFKNMNNGDMGNSGDMGNVMNMMLSNMMNL
jgi:hypothetical protein